MKKIREFSKCPLLASIDQHTTIILMLILYSFRFPQYILYIYVECINQFQQIKKEENSSCYYCFMYLCLQHGTRPNGFCLGRGEEKDEEMKTNSIACSSIQERWKSLQKLAFAYIFQQKEVCVARKKKNDGIVGQQKKQ